MEQGASIEELRLRIAKLLESDSRLESDAVDVSETCNPLNTKNDLRFESIKSKKDDVSSEEDEAFRKIIALVNARDRSEWAMRKRLLASGFSESAIDASMDKAREYGFVDDTRYAELLVRSRFSQGKGLLGVERELKENAIDPDSLPGWPYEYGFTDEGEIERALALLSRKPPRSKNIREGAYRKLIQNGFSSSIASTASRMWIEDRNS